VPWMRLVAKTIDVGDEWEGARSPLADEPARERGNQCEVVAVGPVGGGGSAAAVASIAAIVVRAGDVGEAVERATEEAADGVAAAPASAVEESNEVAMRPGKLGSSIGDDELHTAATAMAGDPPPEREGEGEGEEV